MSTLLLCHLNYFFDEFINDIDYNNIDDYFDIFFKLKNAIKWNKNIEFYNLRIKTKNNYINCYSTCCISFVSSFEVYLNFIYKNKFSKEEK